MNKLDERIVGIIGGLGPAATHYLFGKILEQSGAMTDQQHLHLIIENNPKTPDRNEAPGNTGHSPGPFLAATARKLEAAGADFIVMACNTAHAHEAEIRNAVRIPFVSIIEEVVGDVARKNADIEKIGLLATRTCIDSGIYHRAFERAGISTLTLVPEAQSGFMDLIYRVKAGERGPIISKAMRGLAEQLVERNADVLVAGCTEIPLVMGGQSCSVPIVDSLDVLARRCVAYARNIEPLPAGA